MAAAILITAPASVAMAMLSLSDPPFESVVTIWIVSLPALPARIDSEASAAFTLASVPVIVSAAVPLPTTPAVALVARMPLAAVSVVVKLSPRAASGSLMLTPAIGRTLPAWPVWTPGTVLTGGLLALSVPNTKRWPKPLSAEEEVRSKRKVNTRLATGKTAPRSSRRLEK